MIMFFLPWWIYVLIGTVVFTSAFGGIWLAGIAFDRETEDETYPCLAHLGTDTDGAEDWCGQIHGHSGSHLGMRQYFDADETVSRVTSVDCEGFPSYADGEMEILPVLPQRLSKVPVQTGHNDPWPTCDHGLCELPRAHPGPHSHY